MKLLVVENEPALLNDITHFFLQEKFVCEGVTNLSEALQRINEVPPDCIIFDTDLPGGEDLQLLSRLYMDKDEMGIIVISNRNSFDDKIRSLQYGADDYLTKPVHLPELAARVKAILRRKYANGSPTLDIGALHFDLVANTVHIDGKPISLSRLQYSLLFLLAKNKNQFVSGQAIADYLHNGPWELAPGPGFAYRQIKNLKIKLKEKGCPGIIRTSYGLGYKLDCAKR